MNKLEVVILAAGQGTRMRSSLPKVLHPLSQKPLLGHVIDTAHQLGAAGVHVVVGHGAEQVREAMADSGVGFALQAEQLGTGHAVEQAIGQVDDDSLLLVLYGDVPLVRAETLQMLLDACPADGLALLTMRLDDPKGYGRIVRDHAEKVVRIVEEKDASDAEKAINEGNSGILAAPAALLRQWLQQLDNDNAQGEYYLTDVIALAVSEGREVAGVIADDAGELMGVNDRRQLATMERQLQQRLADALMAAGVTLIDPARFDLRGRLQHGQDVTIDINVVIEGDVELGDGVRIGANCILRNVKIAHGTVIEPMSVIESAQIGPDCTIGPFARIRPGSELQAGAKVGNFVEIKNSQIGAGSKVNHLSYIGDTAMGDGVNIGAGTITANYDGANKHRTIIEDGASTGSNSVLVAPVKVGKGATLGAATTLRKEAPEGKLTLTVTKQKTVDGWQRPVKKR